MDSLFVAIGDGHVENVRALILAGADVNEKDEENGYSALHYSSMCNNADIVKALISAGADVDSTNESGHTAMHLSAEEGYEEVVKALISAQADVNKKDAGGWTALHHSSSYGHTNIVKVLIAAGADLNDKSDEGWTPLHYSAFEGEVDTVKALISAGADVNAKDEDGKTALHHDFIDWDHCNTDIVKALISSGADVNAKDEDGCTPLLCCAEEGYLGTIKALIFCGADVCAVNKWEENFFDLLYYPCDRGLTCIKYTLLYQERSNLKHLLEARNDMYYQIWNEREKQVDSMKETMLGGSCTSFFEFVTETRVNKPALYTSEENFGLKKRSKIISYIKKFERYADEIIAQFKKGRERARLLHQSQEFLLLCFCNTLPSELIRMICECMTNGDVKKLLDGNNIS